MCFQPAAMDAGSGTAIPLQNLQLVMPRAFWIEDFHVSRGVILKCNNFLNSVKICGDILVPFGYFTPLTSYGRRMTLRHNVLRDSVSE